MTFVLKFRADRAVRESALDWLWGHYPETLLGVHEGTVAESEASTDPTAWVVDEDQAPRHRDWVGDAVTSNCEAYFSSESSACDARDDLIATFPAVTGVAIEKVEERDWNADWKASFQGIEVPPHFHVVPPWTPPKPGLLPLVINPGAGFGTGTHETTRLCLQALGGLDVAHKRVLDFGAGSGILAIAAALKGATVDAVEIDELALENAAENAARNGVQTKIIFKKTLPHEPKTFDVVVANILKSVLVKFVKDLCARVDGTLILSGLIEADVVPVIDAFSQQLKMSRPPQVLRDGEWRAIVFKNVQGDVEDDSGL